MAGCGRLFILPHVIGGIGMALVVLSKLLLVLIGTATLGTVESKTVSKSSKGRCIYYVDYSFRTGNSIHRGETQIDRDFYDGLAERAPVQVLYLGLAPEYISDILQLGKSLPPNTWLATIFAGFWNAILSPFVNMLYIRPWRRKKLVKTGEAGTGKVVARRIDRGPKGSPQYVVEYEYRALGQRYRGEEMTEESLYNVFPNGRKLSVIYDPKKPSRSVALDLCEWEIVETSP
jgi:hypothetical protein